MSAFILILSVSLSLTVWEFWNKILNSVWSVLVMQYWCFYFSETFRILADRLIKTHKEKNAHKCSENWRFDFSLRLKDTNFSYSRFPSTAVVLLNFQLENMIFLMKLGYLENQIFLNFVQHDERKQGKKGLRYSLSLKDTTPRMHCSSADQ